MFNALSAPIWKKELPIEIVIEQIIKGIKAYKSKIGEPVFVFTYLP